MKKLLAALGLLVAPLLNHAAPWAPTLTATAVWQSNASNADRSADILGDLQFRADLAAQQRVSLGRDDSLLLGARLETEAWLRFDGLNRAALGPTVSWSHKFGLGPFAPVFSVELAASGVAAQESRRSGLAGSAALTLRKRLDEVTRVSLTYERARHDARATLFDRTGEESAASVSRELVPDWNLTATIRYRRGDVLAYSTPPRPDLVALSKIREANSTFDRAFIAYALDAHSLGGGLALSHPLNATSALTFGYDYRNTTRRPVRYINHLVSAALTHQF
mgnify:FL=1